MPANSKFQAVLLTLKDTKGRDVVEVVINVWPNGACFCAAPAGSVSAVKLVRAYEIGEIKVEMLPPPGTKHG